MDSEIAISPRCGMRPTIGRRPGRASAFEIISTRALPSEISKPDPKNLPILLGFKEQIHCDTSKDCVSAYLSMARKSQLAVIEMASVFLFHS